MRCPDKTINGKLSIIFLQFNFFFADNLSQKVLPVVKFKIKNRKKAETGFEREKGYRRMRLFKNTKPFGFYIILFHTLQHKLSNVFGNIS